MTGVPDTTPEGAPEDTVRSTAADTAESTDGSATAGVARAAAPNEATGETANEAPGPARKTAEVRRRGAGRPPTRASRLLQNRWAGLAGLLLALLAPFVDATPYALSVMTSAAIFVMLAAGLNIVVGYCGLLDLGYVAFFAVGAYTSGVLATRLDLPLVATVPVVIVVTVVAGVVIGAPTLRLRSDYLAIVTLGFGEIIRITANNLDVTGGPSGIYGIPGLAGSPVAFYYLTVVVVALAVLGAARLGRSRIGRAWRFVREDEDAAEAMGVHTYRVKLAAYIAGAVWGGLAGVLFAAHLSAISPGSFTFLQSALVLMAVVLGGMGSVPGVVIGAIVISILPEILRDLADYRFFLFGVLLIAVMLLRPQGLWPARSKEVP
ncbi:branched-chain amino acid ABC transporter permease [Streptosporangium pseudovulgare]|uniref:Branched-chain amino acid ABC transporter permease n=1 Tax=Streptosporangium pseudovulgare TaxID=35765 RepID=A0ABQ2R7D1_9ACTN|nr:branched-chain amino acid ABC transporter permease [Streptosporangium pseudovulgare]GGQ16310.1 branched-chain amino acid ABC transporter permease [Streptosporangium pseudovulgare]